MADPTRARLNSADHALIHAVGWMAGNVMAEDPNVEVMLDVLGEVLPACTRLHPLIARFAAAAEDIVSAASGRERSAACDRARGVVLEFHMRRAGDALELFRKGNADV